MNFLQRIIVYFRPQKVRVLEEVPVQETFEKPVFLNEDNGDLIKANYVLLDASKMGGHIKEARALNPNNSCLFEGDSARFLNAMAPWLFSFEAGSDFAKWISQQAQHRDWGIFFRSDQMPIHLYKHLRKFLITTLDDGNEIYFRFYNPDVLRAFLPTCDDRQVTEFFGPIQAFQLEDSSGKIMEFTHTLGMLQTKESEDTLEDFFVNSVAHMARRREIAKEIIAPTEEEHDKMGFQEVNENQAPAEETTEIELTSSEVEEEEQQVPEQEEQPDKPSSDDNALWDFGY